LLFKTNRFSRLFPTIGSQIITEPRSLEDFPCLERTSCPTDDATVATSKTIASQFLEPVRVGVPDTAPGTVRVKINLAIVGVGDAEIYSISY
jgi:hypothetical protein